MCGIAGFTGPRAEPRALLEAMAGALAHRGPDESGYFESPRSGLAIRRLSIIDIAGGSQPYRSESGAVSAVFNGEIYGFRALRRQLEQAGHRFAGAADGEVIVHAYEEYGLDFIDHIDGMFALAIWDEPGQRLVLARDRLGKKPLHVATHHDGTLSFASEPAALLADPLVGREVDEEAVALYLQYGYVPAPWSAFKGVEKLDPGSVLVWTPEGIERTRYWTLDYEPKLGIGYDAAVEELDSLLDAAVEARLMSDVPLGAFLSGGIDSSLVVARMQQSGGAPVRTFSIGFSDARYDERPYAAKVAAALGTDHHDELVGAGDLTSVLPLLIRHYGEPYADSSMIPTYYLARMASAHVTVALTGDGGDEILAGYERHAAARYSSHFDRLPPAARRVIVNGGLKLVRAGGEEKATGHKIFRLLRSLELDPSARYADWAGTMTSAERAQAVRATAPGISPALAGNARHPLDVALATDVAHYLPDDLLTKVDIATMANSLEARSPLLDHRLVEWTARLPVQLKQRRMRGKLLLRELLGRRLDPALFERPKMGFAAPIGAWLRDDLRELVTDTLLDDTCRARGYLEPRAVEGMVRDHLSGEVDHTRAIWTMLMLELWHREVADRSDSTSRRARS